MPRAKGELIAPGSGARARPFPRSSSFFSLRASACILHPCSHAATHGSFFASPPTLRRNLPTIPPCFSLARQRSARGCSATRHWDLGPLQALQACKFEWIKLELQLQGSASTFRAYPTTVEFAHQAVLFSFPIAPVAFSLRFRSPRPCPLPLAVHRKYASHASYDDQSETRGGTVILDGVHRYHFCTARPYYDCILPVFCGGWGVRGCVDPAAAWASSQRGGICSTPTPVGAASAV